MSLLTRYAYSSMPAHDDQNTDTPIIYLQVFNKAIGNTKLFIDNEDYETFLNYLRDYLSESSHTENIKKDFTIKGRVFSGIPHQPKNYFGKVELIAYNLSPSRFYLLVKQSIPGTLEKFIRSLSTRYAIYYNKKYQHAGPIFQGPYKSAAIIDANHLLLLTHYLNYYRGDQKNNPNFSTYAEYIGIKNSPWINHDKVITYFDSIKSASYAGINSYQDFVEKYEPNSAEKELLEKIILESYDTHNIERLDRSQEILEKSILTRQPQNITNTKPRQKNLEFSLASSFLFVILVTIGFNNIKVTSAQTKKYLNVSSNTINSNSLPLLTVTPIPTEGLFIPNTSPNTIYEEVSPTTMPISPTPVVAGVQDEETDQLPTKVVIIKIYDNSTNVNIRSGPSVDSEKIGTAQDGNVFELISEDADWYQVKLDDLSVGYVSAECAEIADSSSQDEFRKEIEN